MHPIDLIFEDWREVQNRGAENMHAPVHIVDASKIDENEDSEVVEFNVLYLMRQNTHKWAT